MQKQCNRNYIYINQQNFIYCLVAIICLCLPISTAYAVNNASSPIDANSNSSKTTASATQPFVSSITVTIACDDNSPCAVITNTSKQVLQAVDEGLNPSKTMHLIQTVVAPQFDFTLMTKYALGNNWKLATDAQQQQLITLFRELLIYTYAAALDKFKGAQVTINSGNISGRKATVITKVILPTSTNNNTQPVKVEYDLAKMPQATSWKVYDIKIENASLVTTYRNQFNDVIQSSQVAGLIKQLESKLATLKVN